jgi:hypothetical protein
MVAIVQKRTDEFLEMQIFVNKVPFAHGMQEGDVVSVVSLDRDVTVMQKDGKGTWTEETKPPATGLSRTGCVSAVVMQDEESTDPTKLRVFLSIDANVGGGFHVTNQRPAPWSMHFGLPNSLEAHMIGFKEAAVLWGRDGSVLSNDIKLPPFEAPNTFVLDHPDYVAITLNESAGATLEHTSRGTSRSIFCKLVLYPSFREERMLPRETTLMNNTFSRFEIAFWNPDMHRPYCFHGVDFSFTLNFISPPP